MKDFDSYKILEQTRKITSETHKAQKNYLHSIIDRATKNERSSSVSKKQKESK